MAEITLKPEEEPAVMGMLRIAQIDAAILNEFYNCLEESMDLTLKRDLTISFFHLVLSPTEEAQ